MRTTITPPLFAWEALEDSPSLQTLRDFLAAIPDAGLLDALRFARGKGRDDYPVNVLWGVLLQGQRTLSPLYFKDFHQEVVVPSCDFALSLDAVL